MGDVNSDGVVDMRDIQIIIIAFGSFIGHPRWNSEADLNQDGQIDIRDVAVAARFSFCAGWINSNPFKTVEQFTLFQRQSESHVKIYST